MPELTLATKIQRQKQILEVLRLKTEASLTVRDACDRVGIPTTTYYRHVQNNKAFLEAVREMMIAQEKELLSNLIYAKNKVIYQLMEFAVSPDLTISQSISLSEQLAKIQEHLENRTGVHGIADDDAKEFLEKHVNLKPAESRFKASAPVNMKARKDGSIDFSLLIDDGDIVDVDFS
jgi:AcrR family transcriptional regulator